jgi:carboxymethylenebutenolidase
MPRIHAPVYGFYAGNDAPSEATISKTIDAMKATGKIYDPVTYDGAGHGFKFLNPCDANKKAREDAWKRWKSLLPQ